jgi:hypothetical protein
MGNQESTVFRTKNTPLPTTAIGRHSLDIMRNKIYTKRQLDQDDFNPNIFKDLFPPLNDKESIRLTKRYSDMSTFCDSFVENKLMADFNEDIGLKQTTSNEFDVQYVRSGEELRRSYIAKLIVKNIWNPNKSNKSHNSLYIFDWDDTLLPTSFLTPNGVFNEKVYITPSDGEKISKLESRVLIILNNAIEKGDTYIITNAAPGWVEWSCKRFYPEVAKILNKVNIVSARGEFERLHPGDSRQWKISAFLDMINNTDTRLITNLICIGDSIIEMEAAHILASKFNQAFVKTVKFREKPKPEELYKQLNLLIKEFNVISFSLQNLTVRVDKRPKDRTI